MRRMWVALVVPLVLAACADPLSDVERLADVELAEGATAATVVPTAGDDADAPGFLTQVLAGDLSQGPEILPQAAQVAVAAPSPRGGLFGMLGGSGAAPGARDGPDAQLVSQGETLPYGQIATICGVDVASLGRPVATASGYTVYDTAPASTALRTHYLTGFEDGCARQVTAALALFGDVGTHEGLRYSAGTADLAYTDTDTAYERIKARFCRAASGQPCGSRIDSLAQTTVFLSVYANFGTNADWADILLSDGQVVAMDFKG